MLGNSNEKFDYTGFDMDSINEKSKVIIVFEPQVEYDLVSEKYLNVTFDNIVRYYKGKFNNATEFSNYLDEQVKKISELTSLAEQLKEAFATAKPFSYEEAFKLEREEFRGIVFSTIDVTEMVEHLGKTRIATDGIEVKRKIFNIDGDFEGYKEYHNVYETYEVNGDKIGLTGEVMYAVRCWCTSTNEEHWIWIEEEYSKNPLEAIASTFRIHENIIPHITELKRQGDIMLVELDGDVTPEGEVVPLTKEQYFDLLTMET